MNHLFFRLGDAVIIKASGETAEVVSRAEHATAEPSYYLRYCRADGHAVEQWWSQSALQANEVKVSNDMGQVHQLTDGCAVSAITPAATLPLTVSQALHGRLADKESALKQAEQDFDGLMQAADKARARCTSLSREVGELRQVMSPAVG